MTATDRVNKTGRVEVFSDGVFAIAITLLVLDLGAPKDPESFIADLIAECRRTWPWSPRSLSSA